MKVTISKKQFIDMIYKSQYRDNFSIEGLNVLFEILEELETEGIYYNSDIAAICCDYAEDTIKNVCNMYNLDDISDLDSYYQLINNNTDVIYQVY